jgi:MoaA/NifB/PqqE/SkfB family radical SAM enzyme
MHTSPSITNGKAMARTAHKQPNAFARIGRHVRLVARSAKHRPRRTPPFLVLFINSICNLTCEHCFYWQKLNQRDDLTFEEFEKLSLELGDFENLNLSGGEPFLHKQFAEIVDLFLKNNAVKEVYVPTNGYYTQNTEKQIREVLRSDSLRLFACEISLDGMADFHNQFRGDPKSFDKAMETYDMLAQLQAEDPRLRIHAISTATDQNMDELWKLTEFLYERCPAMDHHNLAIIRGDRKNPSLVGPPLEKYTNLYRHFAATWAPREKSRYGASVEPMLQWGKLKTIEQDTQCIRCTAGNMTGVIYANGDVSVCEIREPLGNLRKESFFQIWDSENANKVRASIRAKECHCTTEVFMWPSIVYQPMELGRALLGARKQWKQ